MKTVAVVPAKNEAKKIAITLSTLQKLQLEKIIVVINGCSDNTLDIALNQGKPIEAIYFPHCLGIDVPRAVGAFHALKCNASNIIFVDGDMSGDIFVTLQNLIASLNTGTDMALVNCYPHITSRNNFASFMLQFREILNRKLGIFHELGLVSPSHGPHGVSQKFLQKIPFAALAKPPLSLAMACMENMELDVSAGISHLLLRSSIRDYLHAKNVCYTIIGDCLEAICYIEKRPLSRSCLGVCFDGYDSLRRFDILQEYLGGTGEFQIFTG